MVVFHVYEAIPDSDIPAFTYLRASVPFPAFVGPSPPFLAAFHLASEWLRRSQ